MAARILPFPARRPANAQSNPYDAIFKHALRAFTERCARNDSPTAAPAQPREDADEILKLLRRIDRRLAKISAA